MAPLEHSAFGFVGPTATHPHDRRVDSLLRALLYITRQLGRPAREADVRDLVGDRPFDRGAFLTAGEQLGFDSRIVDVATAPDIALRPPFVLLRAGHPARVVLSLTPERATLLDMVDDCVFELDREKLSVFGAEALVLREPPATEMPPRH